MSVGQLPPPRARQAADDTKLVQYDQYIDTQIHATRRAVKAVDWATALVMLAAGVIAFLLVAAVVEHWLVPGGFPVAVRTALFVGLVGTLCYYAYRQLWPLCRRSINPVYAAQAIERSSPTLKNSLINLLLFRQNRGQISEAVYHTLEEQAAQGLTRVPIEAAVDRSLLIRVGYVLLAVVALAGLYKVLSPKDPLIAAERVLFPWSDIVPASRVSIRAVTPGAVTVARGEFVDVSAEIHGIDENDPVLLRYTTADGQAVDQPIEMRLAKDGLRFAGRLPGSASGSEQFGLAQNLRYRIEAGDARSLDYAITVVPAPSILVTRVEYDYPEYTGFADRHVENLGDIRAIEGTQVTIHARANGAIQEAHVDFDADGRPNDKMAAEGTAARATFELALREDRQTPRHASYVLRFTDSDGRHNRDPVKHPIAVEPDLVPEAAVLQPQEKLRDVQLNDTVMIDIEARDPDFALSGVRLRGEVAGRRVIDQELLASKHTGRFTARYQFATSGHDLRAGDIVEYWVIANDNRTPAANAAESEHKQLRIASPDPGGRGDQPPPDRIAQNDQPRQNQKQREQQDQRQHQQDEKSRGNQQQQDGGEQAGADNQGGEAQQNGEQGQANKEPGKQGNGNGEPSSAGGNESPTNQNGDENASDKKNQPGGRGKSGQQPKPGKQNNGDSQNSNGEQTGAGAAGGESSQQGSQPDGTRPDGNTQSQPANAQRQRGGEQQQSNEEASPVSAEGDNDAEAFDRIQEHLKRNGELKDGESQTADGNEAPQPSEEQKQGADGKPTSVGGKENANNKTQNRVKNQATQPDKANSQQGENEGQQQREGQSPQEPGARAADQGKGQGAETKPHDLPDNVPQQQHQDSGEQQESPGGQQTSSKGPSGAGNEQQPKGGPNSQPEMKPAEKRQQSGSGEQTDKEEPSAGARGKRESDSHGEEGGDKAGGGEEGGGQKSPRDGTGSAGQNQSADEGAGESSEKGAGDTSPNAGQDATADRQTGQPGQETTGRGSKQRDGEGENPGGAQPKGNTQGDKETRSQAKGEAPGQDEHNGEASPADKPNGGEPTSVGGKEPGNNDNSARSEKDNSEQPGGAPTGAGGPRATNAAQESSSQGEAPPADAANLDYARKQTDLVLDKLAEQLKRKQVDKNLLDKLGWSEGDLRKFVERWQQLKDAAQETDPRGEAARDLDDALRSLGLRRGPLQQGPVRDDTQRDLRQGFRGPVPREYQDRLRAYSEGVSRAREQGE